MTFKTLKPVWLFAAVLLMLGMTGPAQAHGYMVRSIPADRAVLDRAPARLQYWFSEDLEVAFSSLNVRDQHGNIIATGGVSEDDRSLMTVRLPPDLPDGAYIVELRPAFSSDGHVVAESRVFFVGQEIGGIAGQGGSGRAVPLEVLWRAITLPAIMLLFGVFTLYAGVLVPAWGNTDYRAGLLPPRVMNRLMWIATIAWIAALAGTGLSLIQQTMVFFNVDFNQALNSNFWSVVRIGSRFGDMWNARVGFLMMVAILFGVALFLRRDQPETLRPFWIATAWAVALVIGSFSVISHAAGSLIWPWVGIAVDWLHALAVGFWVGGLAAFVLVLPAALRPYEGEARRAALLAALRRFSRMAAAAVFIVISTGLYSASNWIFTPADARTSFGVSLALKLLLALPLLALGALHHMALRPDRFQRFAALTGRVAHFGASLRLEAALALPLLVSVGLLSATPVPVPDFARQQAEVPGSVQRAFGLIVTMNISPGGPGINTVDVIISRDGQPVDDAAVRLSHANPVRDWRSPWQALEPVEGGLYVTVGDEINRTGRWWTLLEITELGNEARRLVFDWDITGEAAVIQTRPPGPANLIALGLVTLALGWAAYPAARGFYHQLDLRPASVLVAGGVTVLTAAALVVGFILIQETRQRYEDNLNPPPQIINSVLPTQASLERGQMLYEQHCIGWQANARDFAALRSALPRLRDEDLFGATLDGWRGLPPCEGELSLFQRWDVVNFLRTLER